MNIFHVFLFISNFILIIKSEIFTSSLKLCHLLQSELNQLVIFEDVFRESKEHIQILKILEIIREYLPKSYFDQDRYHIDDCLSEETKITRFITNPVNAYMIIYRFGNEWVDFQRELRIINESKKIFLNVTLYTPSQNEIKGVRGAFYRLSEFYNLEPQYLADGTLSPEWASISKSWSIVPKHLTPNDLLEIGKLAFNNKDYESSIVWISQAYKSLSHDTTNNEKEILFDILDYLSWAEHSSGLHHEAYEHCVEMIKIHPKNERVLNNLNIFNESRINGNNKLKNRMKNYVIKSLKDKEGSKRIKKSLSNWRLNGSVYYEFETHMSQLLCKYGELWDPEPENLIGTKCYIKKGYNSFAKFVTANVEKILNNPDVFMLRTIASPDDIMHFKKLARGYLSTATIYNPLTGQLETADYRITQSSWFDINSDPVIRKMKAKIQIATGLTLKSSEDLQLANYGIGGYYDTHFDFATKYEPSYKDKLTTTNGGRTATYLLYMSDVTIGGRTGFNRLGVSASPSKGDALFWHNLHKDESGDARTRHIACPVVLGTKWVGNFWIRSKGEELSRPCDLIEQNGI